MDAWITTAKEHGGPLGILATILGVVWAVARHGLKSEREKLKAETLKEADEKMDAAIQLVNARLDKAQEEAHGIRQQWIPEITALKERTTAQEHRQDRFEETILDRLGKMENTILDEIRRR